MESWCLSKHISSLLIFMMLLIFMVGWIQGVCIDEERKALLEIKASLPNEENLLSSWVVHGECCGWERIKCDTSTGHITDLYLSNMPSVEYDLVSYDDMFEPDRIWLVNFSSFIQFEELRSLDLSWNYIHNMTGLERLWSLKKLEILNLSTNYIHTNISPSFRALTSLKILDLSFMNIKNPPDAPTHDISELSALESLEVLDLTYCGYYGSLQITQDLKKVSVFRKLEVLNLGINNFNESIITSLSTLPSLKVLDLSENNLSGPFLPQDLKKVSVFRKLEVLNLGSNNFNESIITSLSTLPSLKVLDLSYSHLSGPFLPQDLKKVSVFRKLEVLNLRLNNFNESIITSLSTLPSLKVLDLSGNYLSGPFSPQDLKKVSEFRKLEVLNLGFNYFNESIITSLSTLPSLKVLDLSENNLSGPFLPQALASFHHLEVLDLSGNDFVGSIPSTIKSLSSLKALSLASNKLNGSLPDYGFCELKDLIELDLSRNMFEGNLPECFNTLSSLKLFDISSNLFTGTLSPSLIANLTSLQYVDFSDNKFEGQFSFSSFSNHTKLEFVKFISGNDMFEIETEEPIGWIPMFQLKVLVLAKCNINKQKRSVLPSFLVKQHKLQILDMSHNSMPGKFPIWLIKNNMMLRSLNLRNNLFCGALNLSSTNHNIKLLDISGNHLTGVIPRYIQKFLPVITHLNLSRNSLDGVIPSSVGDLGELHILDLSDNKLCGEIPIGLLANSSRRLYILKLSNNRLHGEVLSGNLSLEIWNLHLDSNRFTGKIGNVTTTPLDVLDISNNFFTGLIPGWISNTSSISELVLRNNSLEGPFPCGTTSFSFLDISENSFSGPIPSCLNMQTLKHLHLGSNRFTGSIPNSFHNLTRVLTLDISNNNLSCEIPKFLGELSNLRILLLGKNNLIGSIPKQLCQLTNVSLLDLSSNSLHGSIPGCLGNVTGPSYQAFEQEGIRIFGSQPSFYKYRGVLTRELYNYVTQFIKIQDEVVFTTKTLSLTYKGGILDIMSGLDLSCNKLTGGIPEELGLLIQIRALNLSHNMLTGPIPLKLSNLTNIESLDLSSNNLTGRVPPELAKLNSLSFFNVSFNNLSGKLPEMNGQFGTFTKKSYEGNPLLCGPPLENKCTNESPVNHTSYKEGTDEKWYDMDMLSFYGSCGSTWFVFMLGFATMLYINPYWRRRWLYLVEECMYTCYYSLYNLVRKSIMLFTK